MDKQIKEKLITSYNNNSKLRDSYEISTWKLNELDKFISYLDPFEHVSLLDIESGPGQHSKYFTDKDIKATCVDISPNMVAACREKGLEAYVMDFYSLDFEEERFNAVWSMNSLLHVPKSSLELVINNIKQIIKSGGYFYMGVYGGYNFEGVWDEDPYIPNRFFSFYQDEEIKEVVSKGFEIINFDIVPMEGMTADYQSIILRKA